MRTFKGDCEIGITQEDLKQMVQFFLNEKCRCLRTDSEYKITKVKLLPYSTYVLRATFNQEVGKS